MVRILLSHTHLVNSRLPWLLTLLLLVPLFITGCASSASPPVVGSTPAVTQTQPPSPSGVLFGGDSALLPLQGKLGRHLAIVRTYHNLEAGASSPVSAFPSPVETQILAQGSTLLTSVHSLDWRSVADGKQDPVLSTFLQKVNQAALNAHLAAIYVCFGHEANSGKSTQDGTPQDFIVAWRHVYQLAAQLHLNWQQGGHLHWVWIMTHGAFIQHGQAESFWPGATYVDVVGTDNYVTGLCRTIFPTQTYVAPASAAQTPAQFLDPVLTWTQQYAPGLPIFQAEWGVVPFQDASIRPSFIHALTSYLDTHPQIQAMLYWNAYGDNGHGADNACDYRLNTAAASLEALAAMGHDPHFQAQAT
jgi:Glycosyl hydrolase family 26